NTVHRSFDGSAQEIAEITDLHFEQERIEAAIHNGQDSTDHWLYQVAWRPQDRLEPEPMGKRQALDQGGWLNFADRGGFGARVAGALTARGTPCSLVFPGTTRGFLGQSQYCIDPARPKDFQWLLDHVNERDRSPLQGVIHLWSLDAASPEELTLMLLKKAQMLGSGSALHLVQALTRTDWPHRPRLCPRLWLMTRGTQQVDRELSTPSVAQAPLWGLGRVIAIENPEFRCTTVDLDPTEPPDEIEIFLRELLAEGPEDQVAYRRSRRYVARLCRLKSISRRLNGARRKG